MIPLIPTVPVAAALLTLAAGAGVLLPFNRARGAGLDRLHTPLEDERLSLLRSLKELDHERAGGLVAEADYAGLRRDLEARAVAVLRVTGADLDAGELAGAMRRRPGPAGSHSLVVPGILLAVAAAAAAVPILLHALAAREPGELITGNGGSAGQGRLEQRIREHPADLGARIELAQADLDRGDLRGATEQYLVVIRLDPKNLEANTKLGYLLFQAGLSDQALRAVERALAADPQYPDALYVKGAILLQALDRPAEAAAALRAYLAAAPYGAHRAEVERTLQTIDRSRP